MALRVHDPTLAERLSRLFPVCDSPPTAPPADRGAVVTVRRGPDGFVIEQAGTQQRCRSWDELLPTVEFALSQALLERHAGYVRLHAAGISADGRGVLALGAGGAGKSTLALAWQCLGHAGYGDDIVLIDREGQAHAFRRLFKLDPTITAQLGVDPAATPFWTPDSDEVWYDPAAAAGWAEPAPVQGVAIVEYRPGAPLVIEPVPAVELLAALLPSRIPPLQPWSFDCVAAVAEQSRGARVVYGDAMEAARALAQWTE